MKTNVENILMGNIKALEIVQPKMLDASEITIGVRSPIVDIDYYRQFLREILDADSMGNMIRAEHCKATNSYEVFGKNISQYGHPKAYTEYGTSRLNAVELFEKVLNNKKAEIFDTVYVNGQKTRVKNKKETVLAYQKQGLLKETFKRWLLEDEERRTELVALYNEKFNSLRPREYDGSHLKFNGMSTAITLHEHQRNAVARILYGGNTLLAHEVGAGKSFEMIAAVMEAKQLGTCHKAMMVVPNHIIEDMAAEFLRLYPLANILVASAKDFETANRKKFCSRIALANWDCVIIGHSQFIKIPMSPEKQREFIYDEINSLEEALIEAKKTKGRSFSVKKIETMKKSLLNKLSEMHSKIKQDENVVSFEELGVDMLLIDEAHNYKNLFIKTNLTNIAGFPNTEAQKTLDLLMKVRYLNEKTGNKGVVFATGTPVSNSLAEIFTMQRYLQNDTLAGYGIDHFDDWVNTFAQITDSVELAPEGSGYRVRTRLSKFQNLPELMNIFALVADIKTTDTLNLPVPEANYHTILAEPSEVQLEMIQMLAERATEIQKGNVDPSVDNMLKISGDGRKIGLDQRLMDPYLPDFAGSKVNMCVENVFRIWQETAAKKLTQIIFCDFSTPSKDNFNVYDDVVSKLLGLGVPESEIAVIHDFKTEVQKKNLFAKIRAGKIRILLASTAKCGVGTNIQDKLIAIHDLDIPWRPADLEQRRGRIVRQGNENACVDIYRYVTNATFDAYLFQTIQKKQEYISQVMTGKSPARNCDDMDEQSLSYAEIKALCAGDPMVAEKMNLDIEVARLKILEGEHFRNTEQLKNAIAVSIPRQISTLSQEIDGLKADILTLEAPAFVVEEGISPMVVVDGDGTSITYTNRNDAEEALVAAMVRISKTPDRAGHIGTYKGFDMKVRFPFFSGQGPIVYLTKNISHEVQCSVGLSNTISKINKVLDEIPKNLEVSTRKLEDAKVSLERAKELIGKPFAYAAELREKQDRLSFLEAELLV